MQGDTHGNVESGGAEVKNEGGSREKEVASAITLVTHLARTNFQLSEYQLVAAIHPPTIHSSGCFNHPLRFRLKWEGLGRHGLDPVLWCFSTSS